MRSNRLAALNQWRNSFRMVSTSSQKNDSTPTKSFSEKLKDEPIPDFSIEAVRKSKNWVSYGFSITDKEEDRRLTRATYFLGVSVILVGYIFVWSYLPDMQQFDWSQREAYIVLREREEAGLEPIAPDYIDPATVELPSDEELGNTEIII